MLVKIYDEFGMGYKFEGFNSGVDLKAHSISIPYWNEEAEKVKLIEKYDLDEPFILQPNAIVLVHTGLHIILPKPKKIIRYKKLRGYKVVEAQIRPRSGLSLKHDIIARLGTADNGYTGDVGIILKNAGKFPFKIEKGMRLAQLVFNEVIQPVLLEIDEKTFTKEAEKKERGAKGFGSSGI